MIIVNSKNNVDKVKEGEIFNFKCKPIFELFYSKESGFGIYKTISKTRLPESKNDIMDDEFEVVIKGNMEQLDIGTEYEVVDAVMEKSKYGFQYSVGNIISQVPKTEDQKKLFLSSLVTEKEASNLLGAYPNIIEKIMNNDLGDLDLRKVKGIGVKKFEKIKDKVEKNFVLQEILVKLSPIGVTRNMIKKMLFYYKDNVSHLKHDLEENPYCLTKVKGFGFKKVDKIALGMKPDLLSSNYRLNAFLNFYLKSVANGEGHTYVSKRNILNEINNKVPECLELFKENLKNKDYYKNFLIIHKDFIGLRHYLNLEKNIYLELKRINDSKSIFEKFNESEIESSIKQTEINQGFKFDESQKDSIKSINDSNVIVITAPAGGGKSSVLKGVVDLMKKGRLENKKQVKISQCALSARAAKRIRQTTKMEAKTLHRTLGSNGVGFKYNKSEKMPHNIYIVDEMSMINLELLYSYFSAIPSGSKLILVFDFAQLPPIGSGDMSRDILKSKNIKINKFTKIYRQGDSSGILEDSNMIRKGINPFDSIPRKAIRGELKDMFYLFGNKIDSMEEKLLKRYFQSIKQVGIDNVMLITPKKKNGKISSNMLNTKIQNYLIREDPFGFKIEDAKKIPFKNGAKVIYRKNNYERNIFNGDEGYIVKVDKVDKKFFVKFSIEDGDRIEEFHFKNLSSFDLGYCVSIHFSQGSEAHTVICAFDNSSFIMQNRRILYTGLSRAKERCLFIGQPTAFKNCIADRNNKPRKTWSDLFYNKGLDIFEI